jgi:hypothetical protein
MLADGTDVEILNVIDDHSRLLVASGPLSLPRPPTSSRRSIKAQPKSGCRRRC